MIQDILLWLWDWAIDQAKQALDALMWALNKVGEILTALFAQVNEWLEIIFR